MGHVFQDKKKIQSRLNRVIGQLQSVGRRLEEEPDCYQVLQQLTAARGALHTLIHHMVEAHLRVHVVEEDDAQKRAQGREEVLRLVRSYLK